MIKIATSQKGETKSRGGRLDRTYQKVRTNDSLGRAETLSFLHLAQLFPFFSWVANTQLNLWTNCLCVTVECVAGFVAVYCNFQGPGLMSGWWTPNYSHVWECLGPLPTRHWFVLTCRVRTNRCRPQNRLQPRHGKKAKLGRASRQPLPKQEVQGAHRLEQPTLCVESHARETGKRRRVKRDYKWVEKMNVDKG